MRAGRAARGAHDTRPPDALHRVRVASTRVALISTAIVAAVYLVIAVVVVLIVTARETSQVDTQLSQALARLHGRRRDPAGRRDLRHPPLVLVRSPPTAPSWSVTPRPSSRPCTIPSSSANGLPASAQGVEATPLTVSVGGADFRVIGTDITPVAYDASVGTDPATGLPIDERFTLVRLVIGQSLSGVTSAEGNLILAEAIVGPILLLAVFLGALTIGRRVAAPIEEARVRQMEFTADASHELRTPLSVIEAQTSLALAEPRDPAWYRAAFQRVQGESGRIRRLVEDLLWLARFDTTRDRAPAEHVDLAILAEMAADRFTAVAEAKRVRLSVRTRPGAADRPRSPRVARPASRCAPRQRLQVRAGGWHRRRRRLGRRQPGPPGGGRLRSRHPGRGAVAHLRPIPPCHGSAWRCRPRARHRQLGGRRDRWPLDDRRLAAGRGQPGRDLAALAERCSRLRRRHVAAPDASRRRAPVDHDTAAAGASRRRTGSVAARRRGCRAAGRPPRRRCAASPRATPSPPAEAAWGRRGRGRL